MADDYSEGQLVNSAEIPARLGRVGETKSQSELERFASTLIEQRELLEHLEHKLEAVSSRAPSDGAEKADNTRPHLSSLIDVVSANNHKIKRLINELVV